jgi:hypothetical protein
MVNEFRWLQKKDYNRTFFYSRTGGKIGLNQKPLTLKLRPSKAKKAILLAP